MENHDYERKNHHNHHDVFKAKKRNSWVIPVLVIALVALAGVAYWGYNQNRRLNDMTIMMENQYSRAFLDLSDYVDNVEVMLAKSLVTSSPRGTSTMLEEVWRQANLAQTNMGQLPVSPPVLEKTSNFLTQVGDLAYAYNTKTANGASLSDKEYDALKKMHGYAVSLQNSLHKIQDQIIEGKMAWGVAQGPKQLKSKDTKNNQTAPFENVEKNFQEYPSMIYDGPYSDHMMKTKPVGLKSGEVDVQTAEKVVRKLIGENKIDSIKRLDDSNNEAIKTYRFSIIYDKSDKDGEGEVDITKKGGQVFWMLRNRPISDAKLSMDDAKKAARDFLKKNGFESMKDTYYMKNDSIATICFAYEQDGIVVYPDLVKVKVALDNGEVLGIEAKGYLYNHKKRDIPAAKLTIEEARSKINKQLKIDSQKRAIIPTDFKTEKYCYEFTGKVDKQKFIIYINAETGAEEDVLMLVDSPDGTLTM